MSRERMNDLLVELQASGWRLLSCEEYPRGNDDPFVMEDDQVKWGLLSSDGNLIGLEFRAFDDLGRRTVDLRDILYCEVIDTGNKLYFVKRQIPEWKATLSDFVAHLGRK
jgi:hypothetical protein